MKVRTRTVAQATLDGENLGTRTIDYEITAMKFDKATGLPLYDTSLTWLDFWIVLNYGERYELRFPEVST